MSKSPWLLVLLAGLVLLGAGGYLVLGGTAVSGPETPATHFETVLSGPSESPVVPAGLEVSQSAPQWISIDRGVLPETALNPDGIEAVNGVIEPVDNRPVFRTDSNLPGTDSPGTSFIVGHNFAQQDGDVVPFAALEFVRLGDTVSVGTETGVLNYSVTQILRVPKSAIAGRADLLANVPGRLILATCDTTASGQDTTDNLVIVTELKV